MQGSAFHVWASDRSMYGPEQSGMIASTRNKNLLRLFLYPPYRPPFYLVNGWAEFYCTDAIMRARELWKDGRNTQSEVHSEIFFLWSWKYFRWRSMMTADDRQAEIIIATWRIIKVLKYDQHPDEGKLLMGTRTNSDNKFLKTHKAEQHPTAISTHSYTHA